MPENLAITVPDEALSAEIDAWEDGQTYDLKVRQDSTGAFTLLEAAASEVEDETEASAPESDEMMAEKGGKSVMKGGNPAIIALISKGAKK